MSKTSLNENVLKQLLPADISRLYMVSSVTPGTLSQQQYHVQNTATTQREVHGHALFSTRAPFPSLGQTQSWM